ncbi:MAG: hypothetical protein ACRDEA_11620, partial [Microcystaceae cyanobacterium]
LLIVRGNSYFYVVGSAQRQIALSAGNPDARTSVKETLLQYWLSNALAPLRLLRMVQDLRRGNV